MRFLFIFMFLLSFTNNSSALSTRHLERLKNKKDITYDDLAHENIGCPENSECSPSNGKKLETWLKILKGYSKDPKVLSIKLERHRKKTGLPINFLSHDTQPMKQSLDPVIWDSRCRHHNIKDQTKIIKGLKFFRNNPKSKSVIFTKVFIGKDVYEIPYGDQPLMIWRDGLIVIKHYDDYLYHLSISSDGKWKVVHVPPKLIKKGRISKSNTQCKERAKPNEYFLGTYCSKIWNEDKKDYELVEQQWPCP